jgi:3',5'-cyclic AMP phosphodiesterase CpdA
VAVTKVLHFSDVHLQNGFAEVPIRRFLNKRLVGWANLRFHRQRSFAQAADKVRALADFATEEEVDLAICTGDYTVLGTQPELAYARQVIEPLVRMPLGFMTVPGNHDIYLPDAVEFRWFERYFGEYLDTELPEYAVQGTWPWVRFPAEGLAVVGVNSVRPNPPITRSSGRVPDEQLSALARILLDPRVRGRFVIIATHYAPRLSTGRPDSVRHGLVNAEAFLEVCGLVERGVVLHGHVHHRYHVRVPEHGIDLCCAGSTTHAGREGLWLLELDGDRATATPGHWDQNRYTLDRELTIELPATL